jgi:hypothetical protein
VVFAGVAIGATMLAFRMFGAIGEAAGRTRARDDQPATGSPKSVSLTTIPERS